MSSKRATLHGIELDERPSPLKKRLGDLRVKDTNILGDGNYVDVELEAVDNSTNPKKRKTRAGNLQNLPGWFVHRLMLKIIISPSLRPAKKVREELQDL